MPRVPASRTFAILLPFIANIAAQTIQTAAVPNLIRVTGSYHALDRQPQIGVVGVTFSIYREQHDGAPLWTEVQNIQVGKDGSFTALLGSAHNEGLPLDLFSTADPRWLEVEIDQMKDPRILLVSVPYAVKAADADTLGGLPSSAYLRANPLAVVQSAISNTANPTSLIAAGIAPLANSGVPNCIGMFLNTTDLTCAAITQSLYQGTLAVSIGAPTTYYGAMTLVGNVPFGDAAGMALYNAGAGAGASVSIDLYNTPSNSGIPQAKIKAIDDGSYSDHLTFWTKTPGAPTNQVTEKLRITSGGNVGIGTTTPSSKLEVNGNLTVDGNINLSGTIQSGSSGVPLLQAPTTGNNFGVGYGALQIVTPSGNNGTGNTAVGTNALHNDTTGPGNTAVGAQVLQYNTIGYQNTGVGAQALSSNSIGNFNTAVGYGALSHATIVDRNTAIGYFALNGTTTGGGNTALGTASLADNTTGSGNTALGDSALENNTTGVGNTAVGDTALSSNTNGSANTAVGTAALNYTTTGGDNTAVGLSALQNNTTGNNNAAIGNAALVFNTTGSGNTVMGNSALYANVTGGNNVALGNNAGYNLGGGDNNVYISNIGPASVLGQESGFIRIGTQGVHLSTFMAGIRGVTTGLNNAVPVMIDANGQLGTISSSRRFKKDIEDMGDSTASLMRLRPVVYRYRQPFADGSEPIQYGLIAEEVAEVFPELVAHSADGQIETVKYQLLDSMLLNEVQRLHAQNVAQQEKIHTLEERLSRVESLLERTASSR